jgi:hypothetical protein
MKAFINGKRTKSGRPFYSLMEMSAASGLPVYDGGEADVVFNWGGGGYPTPAKAKVLNRNPIFNKYNQARAMLAAGVRTPQAYAQLRDVRRYPVVRKPEESFGGHGIALIEARRPLLSDKAGFWYQEFVDKTSEYRVYFFLDEICMVEEKIVKDKTRVTWNLFNCLRWEGRPELRDNEEIGELVVAGAKALRIDWGAADVLEDKTGSFWICEINSRPSCWGGQKPKLPMVEENGVWKLVRNERNDLDLSARMWANRMKRFLKGR